MMTHWTMAAALALALELVSTAVAAGDLYGVVTVAGAPLVGASLDVVVEGGKKYSTQTDAQGSYRLFVPEVARVTFTVHHQNQAVAQTIRTYENSARYDFVVESAAGKYSLRRK